MTEAQEQAQRDFINKLPDDIFNVTEADEIRWAQFKKSDTPMQDWGIGDAALRKVCRNCGMSFMRHDYAGQCLEAGERI